jgi:hypothetical protein
MNRIFNGFHLELVMDGIYYEVETAKLDAMNNFIVVSVQVENTVRDAELIIRGSQYLFASVKVKIRESWTEKDNTMLVCEAPPNEFRFFKRNFLRLETDIPVEYAFMKAEHSELIPISVTHNGTLNDISPCGALLDSRQKKLLFSLHDPSLYIKLNFSLPNDLGIEAPVEIVGKIVNYKKTWSDCYLGILFLINSFQQYRFLESFYKDTIARIKTDQNESLNLHEHLKKVLAKF